jgi:hypothetical protein|tara:strand:- start:427 stop:2748 length:2322 start_codon:yes stop_codon:yes gene_type:complete
MATQHDYDIANGTGQAVRGDINSVLQAIVSNNSGTSEPSTTFKYQWWADETNNVLKIRNSANNAWITLRELDGTLLIEDGSASTPGLAFADDVNTGIFSPTADQIGFATGGAERLRVGSSEVVVNDPSNNVDFRVESNGNTHMLFVDAGNDRVGIATSSPGSALDVNGQVVFSTNTAGKNTHTFTTNASNDGRYLIKSDTTTKVDIQANGASFFDGGNIGIGETAPANLLHVKTSDTGVTPHASAQIVLERSGTNYLQLLTANTGTQGILFGDSDDNDRGKIVYDHSSDHLRVEVATSEAMRIDSNGRMMLGTSTIRDKYFSGTYSGPLSVEGTTDATRLVQHVHNENSASQPFFILGKSRGGSVGSYTVVQDNDFLGTISFQGADGARMVDGARIEVQVNGTPGTNDMPTDMVFKTNSGSTSPTERVRIDSSGRLLVGTSSNYADSGADDLVVGNTGTSEQGITIGASTSSQIRFADAGSNTAGYMLYNHSDNAIAFGVSSERMRISSAGNVGIANTSPSDKLHVGGNIRFGPNTTYYGVFEHDASVTGANIYTSKDTGGHIFKTTTSATESLRLTQDGKLRVKMNDFGNDPSASNSGLQLFDTSGGSITSAAAVTTGSSHAVFLNPNGVCGTINTSGSTTAYNQTSDYRLKENVVDLNGAITRVKQLAPKRFNFIADADTTVDGFLAHEAQTVVPEAVTGAHNAVKIWQEGEELPDGVSVGDNKLDEDGNTIPDYQGIDQSKLVPLLTAALQEAIAKIETLEAKVAALEAG